MDQVEIVQQIEELIHSGNLNGALDLVLPLEEEKDLQAELKIKIPIFKSRIYCMKGNYKKGLILAEQAIQKSQQIENMLLTVDAHISMAYALLELSELDKCLEEIENGENILKTSKTQNQVELVKRNISFNLIKGKIFRKKGELDLALDYLQEILLISLNPSIF